MSIINNSVNGLRPIPALAGSLPVIFSGLPPVKPSRDAVQGLQSVPDSVVAPAWKGEEIDRKFFIMAVNKGALVDNIGIGQVHSFCQASMQLLEDRTPRRTAPLPLMPAVAGTATDAKDKNFTAAITAVNTLFAKGNEPKLNAQVGSFVRRVATAAPDLSRFNLRLAQLWWYISLCELGGKAAMLGISIPPLEHMSNLTQINGAIMSVPLMDNWIMVDSDTLQGDVQMTCKVLALASTQHCFGESEGWAPSIVSMNVELPHIRIGYCGTEIIQQTNKTPSSHDVWSAAVDWAAQVGCTDMFMESVESVASLIYSVDVLRDPIFSAYKLTLSLPPHDSRHYALFPFALACNTLVNMDTPVIPLPYALACAGVVHAQLLNAAFKEVMWTLGLGASEPSARWKQASANWRRKLLSRFGGGPLPLIGVMLGTLSSLGVDVGLGHLTASAAPHPDGWNDNALYHAASKSASWAELFDVLPKVPDAAVKAWTHPEKTAMLVQPNVRYLIDNVAVGNLPSTAAMLLAVRAKIEQITKGERDWVVQDLKVELDRNGLVDTHPFWNTRADKWAEYKIVVTFPDATSCLLANHNADRRAGWQYYLAGVHLLKTQNLKLEQN